MRCRIRTVSNHMENALNERKDIKINCLPPPLNVYGSIVSQHSHPNSRSFITRDQTGALHYIRSYVSNNLSQEIYEKTKIELSLINQIEDPHLGLYKKTIVTKECALLIRDYVSGYEPLSNLISKGKKISCNDALQISNQIVKVVSRLHRIGIPIQSLSPSNILISNENQIMLVDFGLSIIHNEHMVMQENEIFPKFLPPEIIQGNDLNPTLEKDIWMLGVSLYELFTSQLPWQVRNLSRLMKQIIIGKVEFPDNFDQQIASMISQMLSNDPSNRPLIDDVMKTIYQVAMGRESPLQGLPSLNLGSQNLGSSIRPNQVTIHPIAPPSKPRNKLNRTQHIQIQQPIMKAITSARAPRRLHHYILVE